MTTIDIFIISHNADNIKITTKINNVIDQLGTKNNLNFFIFTVKEYSNSNTKINVVTCLIPNTGIIFTNLLKFNYFLKYKTNFTSEYVIYIGENTHQFNLQNLNFSDSFANESGDIFGCSKNVFSVVTDTINCYIQNDMLFDVNVRNWNYQLKKILKLHKFKTINNVSVNFEYKNIFNPEKKYVTIHLTNGLGNLLFQVFTVYQYAKQYNLIPIFSLNKNNTPRPSISKYRLFDRLLKYSNFDQMIFHEIHQSNDKINDKIFACNIKLIGLFINQQFIYNVLPLAKEILCIDVITDSIYSYFDKIRSHCNGELVSIHVRRTDYLKCNIYCELLCTDYYKKAINLFNTEKTNFLIFSDDIETCKQCVIFCDLPNKIFVEGFTDEQSLILMSKCDHNIIANSTFSLWGHYFNENPNKKIVVPETWFVSNCSFKISDILPVVNHTNSIIKIEITTR